MIGERIGTYQITHKLAEGGMGAVYVAHHDLMQRDAVVKVLLPTFSENTNMIKRFFNEARAAASIHHPGIVEIYDLGFMDDGRAYIVMEKLRGETLTARIARQGQLAVDRATTFVLHMASALGAAHDAGIIHRDLKPDNLFVVPDPGVAGGERIKVVDFGIAKLQVNPGSLATAAGSIFGTPAYMAPEQCSDAAAVDGRADVYALGCIYYEMLCGDPPFGKTGGIALLAAQLRDTPPLPRTHNATIPEHVEHVIMRALEKEPDTRYQSCGELAQDLGVHSGELRGMVGGASASSAPATQEEFAPTAAPPHLASPQYSAPPQSAPPQYSAPPQSAPPQSAPPQSAPPHLASPQYSAAPQSYAQSNAPVSPLTTHGAASGQQSVGPAPVSSELGLQASEGKSKTALYVIAGVAVLGVAGLLVLAATSGSSDGDKKPVATASVDAAPTPPIAALPADAAVTTDAGPVKSSAVFAELERAVQSKDYPKVATLFKAVDKSDDNYAAAQIMHAAAMVKYVELVTRNAVGFRKTHQCHRLKKLAGAAREVWPEAGTAADKQLKQCRRVTHGSIVGVVTNAGGKPVANVQVRITSGMTRPTAKSDSRGRFSLNKLKAGWYMVKCGRGVEVRVVVRAGKQHRVSCKIRKPKGPGQSVAELIRQARVAVKAGQFGKAIRSCNRAIRKGGGSAAAAVCAIAACNLRNRGRARRYIRMLRGGQRAMAVQICLRNGINLTTKRPPAKSY